MDDGIGRRIEFLEGDFYQVRVRLLIESDGVVHKEFDFGLAITREPVFNVELAAGGQGEQAKRLVNARRIQEFIAEGNELLQKCAQLSNPPYHKVKDWEEKVMAFVKANYDEPHFLAFSGWAEVKSYRGAAVDRPLVDWINSLVGRLGELLTELCNS